MVLILRDVCERRCGIWVGRPHRVLVREDLSRGQVRWSGCEGGVSPPTLLYLHCARLPGDSCVSTPLPEGPSSCVFSSLHTALHSAGAWKCFRIEWMVDEGWMGEELVKDRPWVGWGWGSFPCRQGTWLFSTTRRSKAWSREI